MSQSIQTPNKGYFMGARRDFHDSRDHVLRMMKHKREAMGEIDVFTGLSLPVYDQGRLGSCTANAGVLYRRWLAQKFPQYSSPDCNLSRLFLYYQERALPWNNTVNEDSGASTRDVMIVILKTGICPEIDFPYDVGRFASAPTQAAQMVATAYKDGAYHRVPDADGVISSLVSGYPVLIGTMLYPEFENIGPDGIMPIPKVGERPIGGHEMVIHGYSSARKAFRLQNSWGLGWGDHGHLWMPEQFLDDVDLSQADFAIAHLGPPWK
jgi:C1A family cysteine protease